MHKNNRLRLILNLVALIALASAPAPTIPRGWIQLLPTAHPGARSGHGLAYDSRRGVVVEFGGEDQNGNYLAETWELDVRTRQWTQRFPLHSPPGRWGMGLTYDTARGVTVLFGGTGYDGKYGDTWLWDGQDWIEVFPAHSPAPRYIHGQTYDSRRQVVVIFGGIALTEQPADNNDMWQWNGQDWTQRPAVNRPQPRYAMGLAYDSQRDALVMFGGVWPFGFFNDTWEYRAGTWVQRQPAQSPPARSYTQMVYSTGGGYTVLFGGQTEAYGISDDTWLWDGVNWHTTTPPVRPPARSNSPLAYVSPFGAVVLFGGLDAGFGELDDTWAFFDVR